MTALRVLIVDDEPLARRRLQIALAKMPDLAVPIGMAGGCVDALGHIASHRPDVVLLDIAMRDGSGFDVAERLDPASAPAIIFVTAFDAHAIRAFEIAAVGYLLKPVQTDNLRLALDRARSHLAGRNAKEQIFELRTMIADMQRDRPGHADEDEFWVRRTNGSLTRVSVLSIEWVSVEDDYVRLHVGESSHLVRGSIKRLHERLGRDAFVQVHRNALARLADIREVTSAAYGKPQVLMRSGQRINAGRVYAKALRARLPRR